MCNTPLITSAEARAFRARWRAVNQAERQELRAATPELKYRQMAALMTSVDALGWRELLAVEEEQVRQRWIQIRKVLGA